MAKKQEGKNELGYKTPSGIELPPVYIEPRGEAPGAYPFRRGVHSTMYRGKLWTMRQYSGFGTAKETNKRYRYLLSKGTTGLSVAFDLPTQMGRDPDSPISKGEVGKVGVSIATIEDMELLLDSIPLDKVSISMTINSTAAILLAFLLVVAERRGVKWSQLNGTVQNDLLKEYIARGTYIYPPTHALRVVTDIIEYCGKKVPKWNTISISGYHIREAGSTAVQEVAFTLANGIAYVEAARARGLSVDDFGERLAFFFNCHQEFFEEVAKFRAARMVWAEIMRDRFGVKNPKAQMLRFHTQTAGSSLTAQQPRNNLVRTTLEALAAVLGGTQSLHTNGYDEALGLPTEEAALLALRTQQIIAHETGVPQVADPLGGCYLVEDLTDKVALEARKLIEQIDKMGGMLKAIERKFPQQEIERAAYQYQREIEQGSRIIVGVNKFSDSEQVTSEPFSLNPALERSRVRELNQFRKKRDKKKWADTLKALDRVAKGKGNLMPLILDCVRSGATLGEISDTLRGVFGEYHES